MVVGAKVCDLTEDLLWFVCGLYVGILTSSLNVLILKVKDIAINCRKNIHFFSRSWIGLPSQFCVCNTHKLCKLAQGKFAVGQGKHRENTGNLKIQFEWVPWLGSGSL